jgi:hypothetical protein
LEVNLTLSIASVEVTASVNEVVRTNENFMVQKEFGEEVLIVGLEAEG